MSENVWRGIFNCIMHFLAYFCRVCIEMCRSHAGLPNQKKTDIFFNYRWYWLCFLRFVYWTMPLLTCDILWHRVGKCFIVTYDFSFLFLLSAGYLPNTLIFCSQDRHDMNETFDWKSWMCHEWMTYAFLMLNSMRKRWRQIIYFFFLFYWKWYA